MDRGSTAAAPAGFFGRIAGGMGRRLVEAKARHKLRAEIDGLDRAGALDGVLRDLDMTRADVEAIVASDPGAARRLAGMASRLGLGEALRRHSPRRDVREIEIACTRCTSTAQCERWLNGSAESGIEDFCPNAAALHALRD